MPERTRTKECPMCGGDMHLQQTESVARVPGATRATSHKSREWICPECDYFEEANPEEERG